MSYDGDEEDVIRRRFAQMEEGDEERYRDMLATN